MRTYEYGDIIVFADCTWGVYIEPVNEAGGGMLHRVDLLFEPDYWVVRARCEARGIRRPTEEPPDIVLARVAMLKLTA